MRVVATAGDVDHGKSTLVEEKAQGLTIDLGFAWPTSGSSEVAFVDVPGRAGVGGRHGTVRVVATAEHVDHGKSTFAEGKARGLTIDLGFAWATVGDDGSEVAFVDVSARGLIVDLGFAWATVGDDGSEVALVDVPAGVRLGGR